MTLTELGEYGLHAKIAALIQGDSAERLIGDDCAVVAVPGDESGQLLLINADRLARDVPVPTRGPLLVTQTLSDIYSMGGRPFALLVAMVLPRDATEEEALGFLASVKEVAARYDCPLVGGDTKEGTEFTAVGIGLGVVPEDQLVRRVPIRAGDLVGVTVAHGEPWGRRWALHLVESRNIEIDKELYETLTEAERSLQLPVAETRALIDRGLVRAGLDLSDGIGGGLEILAAANGVGFEIESDAIAGLVDDGLASIANALEIPLASLAFAPGYGWENMFVISPDDRSDAEAAAMAAGGRFVVIGRASAEANSILLDGRESRLFAAASDEKFRAWAWGDRTDHWLAAMAKTS